MKYGDALTVLDGDYCGYTGVMVGLTVMGDVIVEFGGRWRATFAPHQVDNAEMTLWNLLCVPRQLNVSVGPWDVRLATVKAKHERVGGPDEQELADWGRTS